MVLLEAHRCVRFLFGKRWFVLIMWQVCSILLCSVNVLNTVLADRNGSTLPFLQLTTAYFILFVAHIWRYQKSDVSWLGYVVVSVFNCAGDVAAVYAYNTTSLSSAMLLTTTVIFWVAPMSVLILKRKLSLVQCIAIAVGLGGVVTIFIADGAGESKWVGNILSLASAVSYAIANILQEKLVYTASVTIYLCRFSIFALPTSGILSGVVEWKSIRDYLWNPSTYAIIFVYGILLFIYYTFVPFVMQFSSAVEMNISLLTSNFFSLAISILVFGQKAEWLYLVGFFCVPIAIVMYTLFPHNEKITEAGEHDMETNDGIGE